MKFTRLGLASGLAVAATTLPVWAADAPKSMPAPTVAEVHSGPYVAATLDLELENDYAFSSDDPGNEINDLYLTGEVGLELGLNENFALVSAFVFEPVLDPTPFQDRYFGDHGLYVDSLFLQVTFDPVQFIAGKIHPGFGQAWDVAPGIYGTGFAEDYEIAEQLGFGATTSIETATAGKHTLGAYLFFADTTFLSESAITNRGRTRLSDGGAGNTEEFNNFSVILEGGEIPSMEGFGYHIGYRHLSAGAGDVSDDNGLVAAVAQQFAAGPETTVSVIAEGAYLWNFGGTTEDRFYGTLGAALVHGPWHGEVSTTYRAIDDSAGPDFDDWLFQVSAGREIFYGIDASVGYQFTSDATVDSHAIGVLFTKSFEYDSRG